MYIMYEYLKVHLRCKVHKTYMIYIYMCVCVFVCYINVPGMLPRHLKAESHSETQVAQTPCQGTRSGTRPHLK